MSNAESAQTLMACLHCGSQSVVESRDIERDEVSCIHCGTPVTVPVEDIPQHVVRALEFHQCRDVNAFSTGAAYGALSFGVATTVFTFLPAAWLNWELQGSWALLLIQPAIEVTMWTVFGAIFGGVVLKVLSVILTPSWVAFEGAVRGMVIGFATGAILAAACVAFTKVLSGDQPIAMVWFVYSGQITGSSLFFGSLFAIFGSWAGAILTAPRLLRRQRDVASGSVDYSNAFLKRNARSGSKSGAAVGVLPKRFQFGISRLLFLMTTIAVIIAIPAHFLARLRKIDQLTNYMIVFEVTLVLAAIMLLPFAAWATIRGPRAFACLVDALTRWRGFKRHDLEISFRDSTLK